MPNKRPPRPSDKPQAPIQYIHTRARQLPIHCCLSTEEKQGVRTIIVARRHNTGRTTAAAYLVDSWCTGVKDSMWIFNADEADFNHWKSHFFGGSAENAISYAEAHNRIYGALAWAEDAGIAPGAGWEHTQYILEEDTDEIPLIEYPMGLNGRYRLCARSEKDLQHYKAILDRSLGEGNYDESLSTL
ncbi:MAG: hypothetical protein MJZ51_07370 [Bacteroidales bacterium]|nr:hypothetical protein [Bacteroidales bacterium]